MEWVLLSIWGTDSPVLYSISCSIDFVSRRELSRELSIDSIDAMSTSVARGRVHDLLKGIAIRRPIVS